MKKLLIIALLITSLLGACTQTKKETTLKVLVSADYPPYESYDVSGKLVGFDIDFGNALAEKLGVKFEWVDTSFDGILGAIQGNTADMAISGMHISAEREAATDMSISYKQDAESGSAFTVYALASNNWTSINDLKDKIGSTQLGTVQESALNMMKTEYNLTLDIRNKFDVIVQDILLGRIDFLVADKAAGDEFLTQYPQLTSFPLSYPGLDAISGIGVVMPTGSEWVAKVNAAIEAMKADGSLQTLIDTWFPEE